MTDTPPYTIPKEPRRWRALILAAAVHVVVLGALWIGAQQHDSAVTSDAEPADAVQPGPSARPSMTAHAAAAVNPMAEPPAKAKPQRQEAPAASRITQANTPLKPQEKKTQSEQSKPAQTLRVAALKHQENTTRIESRKKKEEERQKELAQQREKQKNAALASETKKKQEQQQRAALAKKKAAQAAAAAEKAAAEKAKQQELAEAQLREKLRADEMRRIAGGNGNS